MNIRQWLVICIISIPLLLVACGGFNNTQEEIPTNIEVEIVQTEENEQGTAEEGTDEVEQTEQPALTEEPEQPTTHVETNIEPRRFQVHPSNFLVSSIDPSADEEKFVLLTFDDTPTGKSTHQILDILDEYNATAIFFVNGHYAERNLDLLKEINNRGHIIGNHTWWHIYIRRENPDKVREEIVGLNDFLEEHLGERATYFRPPFGQNSEVSLKIIQEEGMQTMNWSNGSLDWELKTPEAITKQVMSNIKNGDNILFHDKQVTADALGEILSQLQEQGYQFVLPTEVIPASIQ